MKFRTSFFNGAAFKKDITRFAPAWALYLVMLLLILLEMFGYTEYGVASSISECIGGTSVLMMIYACLVAQLLFGDLYSARMCNMLHAMPLRRECWYLTHLVSGLLFALVPNLIAAVLIMPAMGDGWSVALWWLLGSSLEYVFFFGLALVCVMCVGSRFAQVVVYGIANFASVIAYGFAKIVYEPQLKGIYLSEEKFVQLSPVWQMCSEGDYVEVYGVHNLEHTAIDAINLGEGWTYLAICAVIGVVLVILSLQMYRRRKLETAGDFIAVRFMEPVFAVVFALICGAVLTMFAELMNEDLNHIFLAVGLIVGFFVALMLVKRTTRVFRKKAFVQVIALCVAMALSLALVAADPMGITRNVPELDEVESVTIGVSSGNGRMFRSITLTEADDIENILQLHDAAVYDKEMVKEDPDSEWRYHTQFGISYTLKNGSTLNRFYTIPVDTAAGELLAGYYSTVEYVTGMTEEALHACADDISYICLYGEDFYFDDSAPKMDYTGLIDAIVADCAAGTMVQDYEFRYPRYGEDSTIYLALYIDSSDHYDMEKGLALNSHCVNTLTWLEENGFCQEYDYQEYN